MRLTKGMRVEMSDGWCGTVYRIDGDIIDCQQNGTAPNAYMHGCRVFSRSMAKGLVVTASGALKVTWGSKTTSTKSAPVVDLERERRDRAKAQLEADWRSVSVWH